MKNAMLMIVYVIGKFMAVHFMGRYIDTVFMDGLRYGAIRVETYKWRDKGGSD